MAPSLRRFVLAAAAFVMLVSAPRSGTAAAASCAFCDSVCYDDFYGMVICTQRCGTPSGEAECDLEPNPCGPLEPVWNHCKDL